MFSTELSTVFWLALAASLVALSALGIAISTRALVGALDSPKNVQKRLTEAELLLQEHGDQLESCLKRLKTIGARTAMQIARDTKAAPGGLQLGNDGLPDPSVHPEEWRAAAMRRNLSQRKAIP